MADKKKYLRITFSNGAFYDIPVQTIKKHYATYVIQQIDKKPLDLALMDAEIHFNNNDEGLIEYATFGMSWSDVTLDVISLSKVPFINRVKEWTTAKKEIIEK